MKVRNWREKCKDRRLWNEIVKQAKTHQGLYHRLKKKKKIYVFPTKSCKHLSSPPYVLHVRAITFFLLSVLFSAVVPD